MADRADQGFRARLMQYLRARTRVGDDAEDIVQEAYTRLSAQPDSREIVDPERFLWRTALNLSASLGRRQRVRATAHSDQAVLALLHPASPAQDEVLAMRERLRVVEAAIDALPERTREVFVAVRIEGMTYSQAATALGISASAVEKAMARAVAKLTMKVNRIDREA
jgi:RNA polymerase sigma factor (sigma-70 family)